MTLQTENPGANVPAFLSMRDAIGANGKSKGLRLNKMGRVLGVGGSSAFDEGAVESPCVWWDINQRCWCMVYTGYTAGLTAASIGLATAPSIAGPWTRYGSSPILAASGSGVDAAGCTGPVVWYEDGVYTLFYIGLTEAGYEGGVPRLCQAQSTSITGTWTRLGAIVSPTGSGWRKTAVYHPSIVKNNGRYYCFFNATGDTANGTGVETIGYASAPAITGPWTVDDANCPLLDVVPATWESNKVGDPAVYWSGEEWVMAYFGYDPSLGAADGVAYTSAGSFPLGWQRYSANPILKKAPSGTSIIDDLHAHKPWIVNHGGVHYHFYTAVSNTAASSGGGRTIALATDEPARKVLSIPIPELSTPRSTNALSYTSVAQSTCLTSINRPSMEMRVISRLTTSGGGSTSVTLRCKEFPQASFTTNTAGYANFYSPWVPVSSSNEIDNLSLEWIVTGATATLGNASYEFRWRDGVNPAT